MAASMDVIEPVKDETLKDCSVSSADEINLEKKAKKRKKETKKGVIYISTIPPLMTVARIREIFMHYGEVGRIFLQPNMTGMKRRKKFQPFTEGWVEFHDKKVAKYVATWLNNTQIGGKRKIPHYDYLWNIKYLHRFKWMHLSERLAYEKAVHDQRMRTEISQAKRETNFYKNAVDKNRTLQRLQKTARVTPVGISQRKTTEEMLQGNSLEPGIDKELLQSIFGGE